MYGVVLLMALCGTEEAAGQTHKKCHPPPVFDGGGDPGYHNLGGWGRPYGGYGWTGYHCPDYWHLRPPAVTLPPEPLFVPPPRRDEEDEESTARKNGDKKEEAGTAKVANVGLALASLNAARKRDLGFPDDVSGVAVSSAEVSGIAHQAGVRKGTLILSIDGDPVNTAGQAVDAINNGSLSEGIRLRVLDPLGKRTTIVLKQ